MSTSPRFNAARRVASSGIDLKTSRFTAGVLPVPIERFQDDVDSATRLLHVERAISLRELKTTKTGEIRTVDLTLRLADALSRWQAICEADALAAGGDVAPWIFPSEARTPLEAAAVYKRFRSLLAKAKLPRFRLYDLRHTFATHLLALGAPITYVAAQLGHSKPTTTLAHYAHWLPRGDKTWIDRPRRVVATVAARGKPARRRREQCRIN